MDSLKPIVQTNQLKLDTLGGLKSGSVPVKVGYDDTFDAFMVKFVPSGRHIVHYLHGDIAALVEPDTLQIVGFWIENFKAKFLAEHPDQANIWAAFKNLDTATSTERTLICSCGRYATSGTPREERKVRSRTSWNSYWRNHSTI